MGLKRGYCSRTQLINAYFRCIVNEQMSSPPDVLVELNLAVELDEGKVVVELRDPAKLVVPDDLLDAVLGLFPRARPRGPVVLAEHHLDVARLLPQHAVRRSQNVPAVTQSLNPFASKA